MNPRRPLPMLLAGLLLLATGCAFYSRHGSEALVGTWTNSIGTVWIIRADGTFDVDLDQDGKRDAWGKWTINEDTVTFVRKGGVKPKGCEGKGVYRFTRPTENTLEFVLVRDKCKLRIKNVTLPWNLAPLKLRREPLQVDVRKTKTPR